MTKSIHSKLFKNCPPPQLGIDGAVFEKKLDELILSNTFLKNGLYKKGSVTDQEKGASFLYEMSLAATENVLIASQTKKLENHTHNIKLT